MNRNRLTNQLVGSPLAWRGSVVDETALVDLDPAEGGLVDLGTVTVGALCDIVDHWTVMAVWPGVPLQCHAGASGDRNDLGARCGALVARDVL